MDTYPFDKFMQLADGAAAYTTAAPGGQIGQVAAAAQILNLGAPLSRSDLGIIGDLGKMKLAIVIDITAMVISTSDDIYSIDIMGSNAANGANGVHLGGLKVGYGTLLPGGVTVATHSAGGAPAGTGSDSFPGRYIIFVDTVQNDVSYQYLFLVVGCTGTGKSITLSAFASAWPPR
jgi:hypothetical protein